MPKLAKTLTALQVNKIRSPGLHAVGGVPGLVLQIRDSSSDAKSWILRIRFEGRRLNIGLGSFSLVSLAEARDKAREMVSLANAGINPVESRKRAKQDRLSEIRLRKTFSECVEEFLDFHLKNFRNEKHKKQWIATFKTYATPIIGDKPISDISIDDIRSVLQQDVTGKQGLQGFLWDVKTETASRLRGRIQEVFAYALTRGYRTDANPAQWKGVLSTILPAPAKIKKLAHHRALSYSKAPKFMKLLLSKQTISARALAFLIFTGVRSGSVRKAVWSEIDFKRKLWTIPAENTKTKVEHRVPLSQEVIQLLKTVQRIRGIEYIFPSPSGGVLSDMALTKVIRDMNEKNEIKEYFVPHGFRSTFRDWAADTTAYPDDIRKAASGHVVGDATLRAYQRTDLLEKRREMMEDWARFLNSRSA